MSGPDSTSSAADQDRLALRDLDHADIVGHRADRFRPRAAESARRNQPARPGYILETHDSIPRLSRAQQLDIGRRLQAACQQQCARAAGYVPTAGSVAECYAGQRRGPCRMTAIFMDCTDDMIGLWHRVPPTGRPGGHRQHGAGPAAGRAARCSTATAPAIVDHTLFRCRVAGALPGLRHIVFLGTGASSFIDLDAAAQHGIAVHTIKGYGDTTVAEHTIALALAAAREVARMDREVRAGRWRQIAGVQLLARRWASSAWAASARSWRAWRRAWACGCWRGTAPRRRAGADAALDAVLGRAPTSCASAWR